MFCENSAPRCCWDPAPFTTLPAFEIPSQMRRSNWTGSSWQRLTAAEWPIWIPCHSNVHCAVCPSETNTSRVQLVTRLRGNTFGRAWYWILIKKRPTWHVLQKRLTHKYLTPLITTEWWIHSSSEMSTIISRPCIDLAQQAQTERTSSGKWWAISLLASCEWICTLGGAATDGHDPLLSFRTCRHGRWTRPDFAP